jgi:plastocyanin
MGLIWTMACRGRRCCQPSRQTVPLGAQATWTNQDDIPHSIVEAGGAFRSHALDTGESIGVTFSKPGTCDYYRGPHPHMTGKIVVAA